MIDIKFKPCCNECKYRKIYTKESRWYVGSGVYDITTVIGCEHEEVCKEYLDYRDPKDIHPAEPFEVKLADMIIMGKKDGDMLTSVIYEGTYENKAQEIFNILEQYRVTGKIVPLQERLSARITRVEVREQFDIDHNVKHYIVIAIAQLL